MILGRIKKKVILIKLEFYINQHTNMHTITETIGNVTCLTSLNGNKKGNDNPLTRYTGIQVCFVRPFPDLRHLSVGEVIPEGVMSFYKVNEVDLFKCDRPFHRGQKDESNEFKVCLLGHMYLLVISAVYLDMAKHF